MLPQKPERSILSRRRNARGLALFEVVVCGIIVAVLAGILLQRYDFYRNEAERVKLDTVAAELRTVLHLKSALLRAEGRDSEVAGLAGENPFEWLLRKPENYRGEWYAPAAKDIEPGNWYFDRTTEELVYLLRNKNTFEKDDLRLIKFKVELSRLPTTLAKPSGTPGNSYGVVLSQVQGER
jgi:general secretion pathway protein G